VAVVTGAAKGIGRAICETMAGAGWAVAGVDLLELPTGQERHQGIRYWTADIADIASHEALLDDIVGTVGMPDCLVNNAGVTSLSRGDLLQLSPESYDGCMAVNVRGSFFLSQTLARRLIASERPSVGPPRSIIWIGSANAEIVGEQRADYCISKAATAMMSKLFAARLAEHDIQTYEIRPGIIATDMTAPAKHRYDAFIAESGVPMRRWGAASDVARAVLAIARGDLPYCTGIHVDVRGGLHLHRV
jgi:NAD(P)-dependent dehydrogenase (short-subunit alcohol dehydrogenase family)